MLALFNDRQMRELLVDFEGRLMALLVGAGTPPRQAAEVASRFVARVVDDVALMVAIAEGWTHHD